ncbi:hypothetical protein MVEN_00459800 [Mycena venus]|uniref:Uncharacterized protein n=1 Tax=Mycena venus TaxID=2733690 RepID=A0A8H6YW91_9AGAR|nr:hypothetical protein MVEN_00459800 [Mycena venus]
MFITVPRTTVTSESSVCLGYHFQPQFLESHSKNTHYGTICRWAALLSSTHFLTAIRRSRISTTRPRPRKVVRRSRQISLCLRLGGRGRPAEFGTRLLLEGELEGELEGPNPEEDDEEAAELARKFSRRQLVTNHVAADLGRAWAFYTSKYNRRGGRWRRRLQSGAQLLERDQTSLLEQIEWDDELDELEREKASAGAIWDLKSRFRAKSDKLRKSATTIPSRPRPSLVEAPPLLRLFPDGSVAQPPLKALKEDMQDFLDDLLT